MAAAGKQRKAATGHVPRHRGVLDSKDAEGTPYGAYLIFARIGADPLNPEGEEADYEDTGDDLP